MSYICPRFEPQIDRRRKILEKRIFGLLRNIKERRIVLALSFVIGVLAGLAAILLKNLTHFVEHRAKSWLYIPA